MKRPLSIAWAALGALLLCGSVGAEVSGIPHGDGRVETIIIGETGITDGVDPIPQIWRDFRQGANPWVLNPSGHARGDGTPHIVFHRPTGWPVAVWSYAREDGTHDIAISHWIGDGWLPTEFVAVTPGVDEMDPRIHVEDDATMFVTWWVQGADERVEITARIWGQSWVPAVRVSPIGEAARYPSVLPHEGAIYVAHQRPATEDVFNTLEIIVRKYDGVWHDWQIESSSYDGALAPSMHTGPIPWFNWRHGVDQFAYAEIADSPVAPTIESWDDESWIGIETIRRLMAAQVSPVQPPCCTGGATGNPLQQTLP